MNTQVIIQDHALVNTNTTNSHHYESIALQAVLESRTQLCTQYNRIIVENAGSLGYTDGRPDYQTSWQPSEL